MESKRSKRVILNIPAEIIIGDNRRAGTIENLSNNGMYIVTAPPKSGNDFLPGTEIEIRFRLPSGKKLALHCKIKWSYLTPPHSYTFSLGLKIKDAPLTYQEALNSLR